MKTKSSPAMTQAEFIRRYKSQKKRVIFYRILILILFFALWEAATRLGLIDPFIFSSPVRLVLAFIELIPGGKIFIHIGITLLETFISFFSRFDPWSCHGYPFMVETEHFPGH